MALSNKDLAEVLLLIQATAKPGATGAVGPTGPAGPAGPAGAAGGQFTMDYARYVDGNGGNDGDLGGPACPYATLAVGVTAMGVASNQGTFERWRVLYLRSDAPFVGQVLPTGRWVLVMDPTSSITGTLTLDDDAAFKFGSALPSSLVIVAANPIQSPLAGGGTGAPTVGDIVSNHTGAHAGDDVYLSLQQVNAADITLDAGQTGITELVGGRHGSFLGDACALIAGGKAQLGAVSGLDTSLALEVQGIDDCKIYWGDIEVANAVTANPFSAIRHSTFGIAGVVWTGPASSLVMDSDTWNTWDAVAGVLAGGATIVLTNVDQLPSWSYTWGAQNGAVAMVAGIGGLPVGWDLDSATGNENASFVLVTRECDAISASMVTDALAATGTLLLRISHRRGGVYTDWDIATGAVAAGRVVTASAVPVLPRFLPGDAFVVTTTITGTAITTVQLAIQVRAAF